MQLAMLTHHLAEVGGQMWLVRLGKENRLVNCCQGFLFSKNIIKEQHLSCPHIKRPSPDKTKEPCNLRAIWPHQRESWPQSEFAWIPTVGTIFGSNFALGTISVHHQRHVAAVKPLIAAALILTQGTKRTLTGPHFSEISSVLFEAQLSADSWLWKKKFTTRSIWLMKGEKVTKVATMISQRKKVLQEMRARSKNWTSTCSIFSFYQFANSRSRTRLWEKRQISCAVIASRSIEQILLNYILHQSLGPCIFPLPKTSWAIKVSLSLWMTHIYGCIFGFLENPPHIH